MNFRRIWWFSLCLVWLWSTTAVAGWSEVGRAEQICEAIMDFFPDGSRQPGSPANLVLEERVAERFAGSGFEHGEMRFTAPSFQAGKTVLLAAGNSFEIRPLHPSLFRPGNFAGDRLVTGIVYAGYGRTADLARLSGQSLRDQIVMLEYNSGRNWERFLRFGVSGFLFVEPENDDYGLHESHDKVHTSETAVPRFFIDRDAGLQLRELIAGVDQPTVEVVAEPSRWENRRLRNLWVLIPGTDDDLRHETALLVAPLDANSVVPELAGGAQNAANLYVLLQMLEQFREAPPARSVLLAAVNARTHNYMGDRLLAWYLLQPQSAIEEIRNLLAWDLRTQELINSYMSRLKFTPESWSADEQFLIELRTLSDRSTGRLLTVKDPIVALCQRDVNDLRARQMALVREQERVLTELEDAVAQGHHEPAAAARRRSAEIEREQLQLEQDYEQYVNVLTLFNRVGVRTELSDLNQREQEILRGYIDFLRDDTEVSARLNRQDLSTSVDNARIRRVMAEREVSFAISLEMVWTHPYLGFSTALPLGGRVWANRWGRNTFSLAGELAAVTDPARPNLLVDTLTQRGGLPEKYYVPFRSDSPLHYQSADGLPAFSLNNVFSTHNRAFTPADRFDLLDYGVVAEVTGFLRHFLPRIIADPALTLPSELPPAPSTEARRRAWTCLVKAFKYDEFSAAVMPEVPVPNSALVLAATDPQGGHSGGFSGGDIVDRYWSLTDQRGVATIYGINHSQLATAVFGYDNQFRHIDHVVDSGESHERINTNLGVSTSRILSVIPCDQEITVWNRHDPSRVGSSEIAVDTFLTLSATRDSAPRTYGLTGASCGFSSKLPPGHHWGPVSFFLSPGEQVKLITEQKRLALAVDELYPEGRGFASAAEMDVDFFRQSVRDLQLLNEYRYEGFHGVTDGLVEGFLARGREVGERLDKAAEADDHLGYLHALYESLGALAKGHGQIAGITNDMLIAVIFFLALLLPFSFFLQKLLFNPVRIEAQMTLFSLIFIACFILFRLIHPAFRIAQAPEAMLVAFVMSGLALFVIYILHSRFEGEMKLLFSNLTGHDDSEIGYSMVGQQAMMIGVGNMKRRRIRTMLTTATIVLVTFTMLAFTSISRTMRPTLVQVGAVAPYTGLMYSWPGGLRMDEASWQVFNDFFTGWEMVTRRWLLPETGADQRALFHVETDHGQTASVDGIMGLAAAEQGFLGSIPIISGRFFTRDDAEEVIISASLADYLRLGPEAVDNSSLTLLGRSVRLIGIIDDERLRMIEDLNGLSILPIEPRIEQDMTDLATDEQVADGLVDEDGVFHISPARLVILPVETARRVGARPYSVSVKFDDETRIWPVLDRLLTATNARFFIGSREPFAMGDGTDRQTRPGTYYVGSGFRTSIGGLAMLIIPLLIASTIILNTMLGSVFERKKEIAVFNAIGLNPTHIGTFFLAESFVYGIIGSVGGYLVGQVLSITLNYYGWITDVNLNFSSLSVAYVIVFTISIVLLSTLYPAIMATKAAVPSGKRKWTMPEHDGVRMEVVFPFIYQPKLVLGVINYLVEYLDQFTESSTGDLLALPSGQSQFEQEGRPAYRVDYEIALPPFDLGVTEKVSYQAAYSPVTDAYQVTMAITRLSGQDSNWVTTNKPFLERLRKFLLHWRNLKPAEHRIHARRGHELFAGDKR